ncbi:MAG: hypothetical protein JWN77_614 [Frankiales bacterium]|nr:hypothetical protein [Frankiales bacterium]
MLKKVLAVATLAGALTGIAATPALAGGQFCYDVQVNANGSSVVSQTGCQPIG